MSKRTANSRQSISSGMSIPASIENITSFEEFLTLAQEQPQVLEPPAPAPSTTKDATRKSSKYGIHIQRNKDAIKKMQTNNFVELNKQKLEQRHEQAPPPLPAPMVRAPSSWRNLIKGVLDLQRGKIPLLLAVEAGNQSMVRELLSAQTAEQLQVSFRNFFVLFDRVVFLRAEQK